MQSPGENLVLLGRHWLLGSYPRRWLYKGWRLAQPSRSGEEAGDLRGRTVWDSEGHTCGLLTAYLEAWFSPDLESSVLIPRLLSEGPWELIPEVSWESDPMVGSLEDLDPAVSGLAMSWLAVEPIRC